MLTTGGGIRPGQGGPSRPLFGWVVRTRSHGWLICDDRTDEFFDFLHLDDASGAMEVIHIKAVKSHRDRRIAVGPLAEVTTQLQKNLRALSRSRVTTDLAAQVENSTAGPLWLDGQPSNDYVAFLTALRRRYPARHLQG